MRRMEPNSPPSTAMSPPADTPRSRAAQDGQARRGGRRLDAAKQRYGISAVQCWTSLEEYFGVVPCTVMSMMSNEPDVQRLRSGYLPASSACTPCALRRARPAPCSIGIITMGTDPDKAVCFHCSNLARSTFFDEVKMDFQLKSSPARWAKLNTHRHRAWVSVKSGPMSFARFSTIDDREGKIRGYVGEGRVHLTTRSTPLAEPAWCEIPAHAGSCSAYICERRLRASHVAANLSSSASASRL